jgi:hypothetical protein
MCLALACSLQPAFAQMPQGQVPGLDAAMAKLFGNNSAFSATATARLLDDKGQETMLMPMGYAALDSKIRSEIDMTQLKSKEMQGEAAASLKQMGMDKMISIVRPDKNVVLIVYPALRAYAETPLPKSQAGAANQDYKLESTKLGAETVDGHPCVKNKVVIKGKEDEKHEAIVWNATDLKDFPVKMQMQQANGTMIMTYSNIKLEKPDAQLFEAPAGFEKHDSIEKLLQSTMMKRLGK